VLTVLRGGLAAVPVRDVVAAFVAVKSLAGKRGEGFFGWIELRVLAQDQSSQRFRWSLRSTFLSIGGMTLRPSPSRLARLRSWSRTRHDTDIPRRSNTRSFSGYVSIHAADVDRNEGPRDVPDDARECAQPIQSPADDSVVDDTAELRCSTSSTLCHSSNEATRSSPGRNMMSALSSRNLNEGVNVASKSAM